MFVSKVGLQITIIFIQVKYYQSLFLKVQSDVFKCPVLSVQKLNISSLIQYQTEKSRESSYLRGLKQHFLPFLYPKNEQMIKIITIKIVGDYFYVNLQID